MTIDGTGISKRCFRCILHGDVCFKKMKVLGDFDFEFTTHRDASFVAKDVLFFFFIDVYRYPSEMPAVVGLMAAIVINPHPNHCTIHPVSRISVPPVNKSHSTPPQSGQ